MTATKRDFKFIHYEPSYSDINTTYGIYHQIYEDFKTIGEENVNIRVFSYFYEGMVSVISGDNLFFGKDYSQAIRYYEQANKLIVRSRASRGREGDDIFNEMVKWANYAEGMLKISMSFTEEDIDNKINLLEDCQVNLQEFIKGRELEEHPVDRIIAIARLSYARYLFFKSIAERDSKDLISFKKHLLKSRTELTKANFIFRKYGDELEELQNSIDEVTKQNIVSRAEKFWEQGLVNIQVSNFTQAQHIFRIASKYYTRASEICSDFMEQRLYLALSKITLASQYESQANELYKREDKPQKASDLFVKASEIVDDALGMLSTIKSESLIKSMTAQRSYYEALSLETKGISLFDQEQFDESLENFNKAIKIFEETKRLAKERNLDNLTELVRTGLSEVEGYISMINAMME